jgi:hypothetical protein
MLSNAVCAVEAAETFLSFPMDSDPGWQTEGQWEFGQPQGISGDPSSACTGTNIYGYNLGGAYANRIPQYWLTTSALDCSGYSNVVLKFQRWLQVESSSYDHAYIQVSTNGSTWLPVWTHSGGSLRTAAWREVSYDISAVADNQEMVYLRWGMGTTDSSVTYCGWNIDDVEIAGIPAYFGELQVSIPSSATESDGLLSGVGLVSAHPAPVSNLVINLVSDDLSEVWVTNTVVIEAGQSNAVFDIDIQEDTVLDGSRSVTVSASVKDYQSGSVTIMVHDNETAVLTLSLPDTAYEGSGRLEGVLQVDSPPDNDIQVKLHSSDTNEISSCTVVVPAGQTLVPVEVVVVDDEVIDGVTTVVVEAYVDNWTGDARHVFVFDNEQVAVAPPIPEEMEEGAMPWPMYQGNKEHTGYVPGSLDPEKSKELWSKTIGSGRSLNPVTIAEGKVYASIRIYHAAEDHLFVLDALTGEQKWTKNFGRVSRMNPPSYAHGNVYIQTGKESSSGIPPYLHAFNAETGDLVFKSLFSAQWEEYYAPTIDDGVVYINGGYYGGMYAFDAYSGAQLWFTGLPQNDEWTPTVGPDYVYSYQGEYTPGLYALNKLTGNVEYRIDDPNFDWNGWSMDTVAVYGEDGLMFAVHDGRLIAFDTSARSMLWEIAQAFKGQPSCRDGVVYALNGSSVSAASAHTGEVLWSWDSGASLTQNIIVTDSHLIVGSASTTYLIDLQTHSQVWSYPKGGHLSLAEGVLYIASSNGELTALSILPRLTIELIDDAAEGDGVIPVAGSVKMEDVLPHDLVVNLFSSDPLQVSTVGPVTIPAGQTNAAFDLEIIDDDLLDGSQLVTIGAISAGYADATGSLWVHDNESAALSLTLPQSTVEDSGGISGMVNVTPIADRDVVVNLVSDNPEKISGGRAVIKAGDTGAAFTLSVLDDHLIDHLQTVTIEAQVENWESARASIFIADNETTDIRLVLPSLMMEGDGVVTNAGEVMLSGTLLSDVHIMLRSSDSSEVTVPFYVSIPAGQSNAFFNITAVDDGVVDGKQYPTITASMPGFIPASQAMSLSDNEFHHFTFIGFNGEDPGYVPVPCSVRAVNIDGEYVNTYSGPAWLRGMLGSDPVAVDPAEAILLTNGLWQGSVTFHGVGDNALIFTDDGEGHVGTNAVSLIGLNIVKMATDWELPYIYMLHRYESSPNKSILIWYNTGSGSIEHALPAGNNATDLTVSYGDNRIYVSNWKYPETRVFDRSSKQELDSLLLGSDVYKINAGRAGRVYTEEEDQWITVRARDTDSGVSVASRGEREGDGDCTLDGRYYYHTDNNSSGARLSRFDISGDAFASEISVKTKSYYGSRNVFVSMDGNRVYNCKHIYDADLNVLLNVGAEIYAASAYGDMVLTSTKAYNGVNGEEVYTLPFSTSVMAFSGDQSGLLLFNSTSGSVTSIATSAIMPIPEPTVTPSPADEAIVGANLPELAWSGAPAALSYDIYIGTDSNAVASAGTNNVQYLGRRTMTRFLLEEGVLEGNQTYFWRVDTVAFGNESVGGDVWQFQTASIAVDPYELSVSGMAAAYTQTVTVAVNSTVGAPIAWTASCTNDWVLLETTSGTASGMLDIGFDLSGLSAGEYTADIIFSAAGTSLALPVTLEVENMRIVKMATDWTLPYIYMAHTSSTVPNKSRLIWYNTDTDAIEHVVDAGENITDLTVGYADNRIYVSNWRRAETRVFDRSAKTPLDPLLLGGDVYKINAAGAGRVITEEEDQWITVRMRDTATGTQLVSRRDREGDGDCTLDGRYYYRCDNNISNARLYKYAITNNAFASVTSTRTKSYYGSRNVFVSMDGNRVYNCKHIYDADLNVLLNIGAEIYAASAYGDMVLTSTKAYNGVSGEEVYTLPFSTGVMAFSGDQSSLLLFNSSEGTITSLNTSDIMPVPEVEMLPVPADGSVQGTNLSELSWEGGPTVVAYDVYMGTDSNAVASASTNSVPYRGRWTSTDFQLLEGTLTGNETYYWRVDIVAFGNEIVGGDVWQFQTASMTLEPCELTVTGIAADYTQTVSVAVNSAIGADVAWTASCTNDWIILSSTNGTTSGTLEIGLDLSALSEGEYSAEIIFNDGAVLLTLPVNLEVFALNITKMQADVNQSRVFALNVVQSGLKPSQIVVLDTAEKQVEQVIPVVDKALDFAVHYGDDRIYVSAFGNSSVSVIDRATFQRLEDLTLHTQVYRISSGITGRLVTEDDGSGNAYYGRMRVWDSQTGVLKQTTASYSTGRGTGESDAAGTFYYRGDSTSYPYTGYLRKYGLSGGTLVSVKSIQAGKSSRRELVLSGDGSRVFWTGKAYDSDLNLITNLSGEVYASSTDGRMACLTDKVMNVDTSAEVVALPVSSTAMAFVENDSALVYFNSSAQSFEWLELGPSGSPSPPVPYEQMAESDEFIAWSDLHFASTETVPDAMADSDGDGQCNLDEYVAGTDPTSSDSCFVLHDAVLLPDGRMVISWDSITGRVYSIYWSPALTTPFELQDDGIQSPQNSYTDRVERVEQSGFYKVGVKLE